MSPSPNPSPRKAKSARKRKRAKKVEEIEMEVDDSSPIEAKASSSAKVTTTEEVPFEELYHNRATQNAAWGLLQETVKKGTGARKANANLELREEREEVVVPKRTLRARRKAAAGVSGSTDAGNGEELAVAATGGGGEGDVENEEEDPDGEDHGQASVHDLLQRYDRNKKKAKPKKKSGRKSPLVLSDCDVDDDIINEDYLEALEGKSDFLKFSVPQYDLKERLYQMHSSVIENLGNGEIAALFNDVLPDLRQIKNEEMPSERHEIFKSILHTVSTASLRELTVSKPFTQAQDACVMHLIANRVFGDVPDLTGNRGELVQYITNVMIPEALVRIFARANNIDVELAEKELRYKAAYDGELPPEVIETIPDLGEEPMF